VFKVGDVLLCIAALFEVASISPGSASSASVLLGN
jgi:hypothetical protein